MELSLLQLLKITLYLSLFYISGFLYVSAIWRRHGKLAVGASIVSSHFLFILTFLLIQPDNPWIAAINALLFSAIFRCILLPLKRRYITYTHRALEWNINDFLVMVFILIIFSLICIKTVIHDDLNHFYFASQIMRGKFPPSYFAFPDLEAKYHYGWAILLANFTKATTLPLYVSSDILTLFSLSGCVILLLALFHRLNLSPLGRVVGALLFFLGGGVFSLVYQLLYTDQRNGLTLLNMFHQHPWTFGISLYLLVLHLIHQAKNYSVSQNIVNVVHIIPFVIIIPIVNATSGPFILLILFLISALKFIKPKNKTDLLIGSSLTILIPILLIIWPFIGGMLVFSPAYDHPAIKFSLHIFSWLHFLKYEIAYVLLLAPASSIVFLFSAWKIIKQIFNQYENITIYILMLVVLFLFPLPILALIENAAYWDNFSKINYFAILSSWIVIAYMLDKYYITRIMIHSAIKTSALILLLMVLLSDSAVFIQRVGRESRSDYLDNTTLQLTNLLHYFKNEISINNNILILNKNIKEMYPISEISNKPDISLYRYIRSNFGEFEILALYMGVSIINFYDYNFLYNRSREYKLRSAIHSAFSGDASSLLNWNINYILCLHQTCPAFLEDWSSKGMLALQMTHPTEGWRLYRALVHPHDGTSHR